MRSNAQIELQTVAAFLYPLFRFVAFLSIPVYFLRLVFLSFSLDELPFFAVSIFLVFRPNLIRHPKLTPEEAEADIRNHYRITCFNDNEWRIEKNNIDESRKWSPILYYSCFQDAEKALEEKIEEELQRDLWNDDQNWEVVG